METPSPRPHRCANECGMCDFLDAEWDRAGKPPADLNFPAYAGLREVVAKTPQPKPVLTAETLRSVREQVLALTPTYQPPIFSSESMAQQYARLTRGES